MADDLGVDQRKGVRKLFGSIVVDTRPLTVVVAGGPRIADLTHGWAAAGVGTAAAASGGGVLVIVLVLAAVLLLPSFWRYRTPAD